MQNLRKAFWDNILEMARVDKKIVVLVGDLGFSFKEKFEKELPDQIINAGVIEQSIVGICAGLAIGGFKPYFYSTIPFALFRPYEFIRDDIAYQNLNVKIVGYSMPGFIGFTHNLEGKENEEDLLKNLPNIKRYYPKTEKELKKAMASSGPAYVHL